MVVDLCVGDITDWRADAVLLGTNSLLVPNGPIQRAACVKPEEYVEALRRNNGVLIAGQAAITTGGKLPATWLIHINLPIYSENEGCHTDRASQLVEAYYAGLRVADERKLTNVAIAPLIGNFPYAIAATVAVEALRFYKATYIDTATLVTLDGYFIQLVRERLYVDA